MVITICPITHVLLQCDPALPIKRWSLSCPFNCVGPRTALTGRLGWKCSHPGHSPLPGLANDHIKHVNSLRLPQTQATNETLCGKVKEHQGTPCVSDKAITEMNPPAAATKKDPERSLPKTPKQENSRQNIYSCLKWLSLGVVYNSNRQLKHPLIKFSNITSF